MARTAAIRAKALPHRADIDRSKSIHEDAHALIVLDGLRHRVPLAEVPDRSHEQALRASNGRNSAML